MFVKPQSTSIDINSIFFVLLMQGTFGNAFLEQLWVWIFQKILKDISKNYMNVFYIYLYTLQGTYIAAKTLPTCSLMSQPNRKLRMLATVY